MASIIILICSNHSSVPLCTKQQQRQPATYFFSFYFERMWNFSVKQLAMSKSYEISIECRVDNRPEEEDESSRGGGWKNWTFPGTKRRCAALSSKKFSRAIQPAIDPYFNECLQSLLLCLSLYKKACMNRTQKSIMVLSSNRKRNLPPTHRQL